MKVTRREILSLGGAALALGCAGGRGGPVTVADAKPLPPTPACDDDEPTEDNIEGPYYKAGAPERSVLVEKGMKGRQLVVTGRVMSTTCAPVAGALLDVWQANDAGDYDNRGYTLRGKLYSGNDGVYSFATIVPGRYKLDESSYRPAHIHVKLSGAGLARLTTQLYFPDDPWNKVDPFIKPSLVMLLTDAAEGGLVGRFDFVLAPG